MSDLPNNLYKYRLFCEGAILLILSEYHDLDIAWDAVLHARKAKDAVFSFWTTEANCYARFCMDPFKILAIAEPVGGMTVVQPNKVKQITEDNKRREANLKGGRVQIGKQAKKHTPRGKG